MHFRTAVGLIFKHLLRKYLQCIHVNAEGWASEQWSHESGIVKCVRSTAQRKLCSLQGVCLKLAIFAGFATQTTSRFRLAAWTGSAKSVWLCSKNPSALFCFVELKRMNLDVHKENGVRSGRMTIMFRDARVQQLNYHKVWRRRCIVLTRTLMPLDNMPPITIEVASVDGRVMVVSHHK